MDDPLKNSVDNVNRIIDSALWQDMMCAEEQVLRDAFFEHFGVHFFEVKDPDQLSRVITQGIHLEQYSYRGETFLYMVRDPDIKEVQKGSVKVFTISVRYLKV